MVSAIRVLHVDDDPIILDISKSILELSGEFIVTTVPSAAEAIRLLEQGGFDSIVSDYQMEGMDGIEFLVEVRSRFGTIPFILFTGKGREEVVIQAINRGADFYLQKGGDTDAQFAELIHKIRQAVARKMAEESLREHDERISLLLNSTAEAIYGLDLNGNCTFCNNACLRLLGYKHPDELLGKNMHWQIHAKHPDGTQYQIEDCRIFQALSKGEGTHIEDEVFWRSDGTSFSAEYWSHPQIHNGKFVGAVVTFLDITERKGLEDEVNYNVQKLKNFSMALAAANRKLTLLSSITRHDILNQLTVLMGYLSLLEIKQRDSTLKEYCIKSTTAAEKISNLIKFTKEYDEIEAHAPDWQRELRTLIDTAAKESHMGEVKVINDLPADLEIFADPLSNKVFNNLMDNAMRYGGNITTIHFSVKESGDEQLIVYEDDGDGVVPEEKEKIFERGYRKKNDGIGLFLSREILAITGITITENGTPGKGTRFEIRVPKGKYRFTGIKTEYIANQSVNNVMPQEVPFPVVLGATTNAAGTVITIRFTNVMNNPAGKYGEFAYQINGGSVQSFSAAALNADPTKIDLITAGRPIAYGDRITVSYTGTDITAADGGVLKKFKAQSVDNAMLSVPSPVIIGATTNAAGTVITLTFDKVMNNPAGKHAEFAYKIGSGSAQSFSAAVLNADPTKIDLITAGRPIAYGDRITVSYRGTDITAADGGVLKKIGDPLNNNDLGDVE
jgi:PAS domain S-box-containing protein